MKKTKNIVFTLSLVILLAIGTFAPLSSGLVPTKTLSETAQKDSNRIVLTSDTSNEIETAQKEFNRIVLTSDTSNEIETAQKEFNRIVLTSDTSNEIETAQKESDKVSANPQKSSKGIKAQTVEDSFDKIIPLVDKGDMNKDGIVNAYDIDIFLEVYNFPYFFQKYRPDLFELADMNSDKVMNSKDINLFINAISNA
ncbi:MAG: hypothetical protein KJ718_02115 [Nanoarchaeota archaeon]|nr:hypothetical protein [Nanoarchaeota archaeon]